MQEEGAEKGGVDHKRSTVEKTRVAKLAEVYERKGRSLDKQDVKL